MKRILLVMVGLVVSGAAYAQATATATGVEPNVLQNPMLLLAVNMAIRYVPGLRAFVTNKFSPIISTLIAWLPGLLALLTGAAQAGTFDGQPVSQAGLGSLFGGRMLGGLGAALAASAQQWFIYEALLKHWLPKKPADSI